MKNKLGNFISKLRNEKGLSQYDLAELIPIGREAISKWERGKTKPSKSSLKRLSEIFEISIEELLSGERLQYNNHEKIKDAALNLYEERNKFQKNLKIAIFLIIGLVLSFFIYYFINQFNSIKVYTIDYNDSMINIDGGILVVTKDKIYFNIGNITTDEDIINLRLYYKDTNNEDKLIFSTDSKYIVLYDYYGYNAYFNYDQIKYIIKNMYLDIEYNNENHTIKLSPKKDFANNKIFTKKVKQISNETINTNIGNTFDDTKIKTKCPKIDDAYVCDFESAKVYYFENVPMIILEKENNEIIQNWFYYLNYKAVEYREYQNNKIINSFSYDNEKIFCNINNCTKNEKMVEYLFEYIDKILK